MQAIQMIESFQKISSQIFVFLHLTIKLVCNVTDVAGIADATDLVVDLMHQQRGVVNIVGVKDVALITVATKVSSFADLLDGSKVTSVMDVKKVDS